MLFRSVVIDAHLLARVFLMLVSLFYCAALGLIVSYVSSTYSLDAGIFGSLVIVLGILCLGALESFDLIAFLMYESLEEFPNPSESSGS